MQRKKKLVCKFSKNTKSKLYHIENSKTRGQNRVDVDRVAHRVAHDEPPDQYLRCLQIQLFSSMVLKSQTRRRIPGKHE